MPCTRDQLTWILTWIVSGCIMKIPIWNWGPLNLNWKIRGQKFLMFMIWWARKKWIVSKLVSNIYKRVISESPLSHLQVTGESSPLWVIQESPGSLSWITHKSPVSQLYVTGESILTVSHPGVTREFTLSHPWVTDESPMSYEWVTHKSTVRLSTFNSILKYVIPKLYYSEL